MTSPSVQRVIGWDVATWRRALPLFDAWLPADLTGMRALEVGGREGGLSLWLAARGADVLCSDLDGPREEVLRDADALDLGARISTAAADATALPWREAFDILAFKSVLGGVARNDRHDRQRQALASMAAALRPGGLLLCAENLAASPLHGLARRLFVEWGGRWRYTDHDELGEDVRDAGFEILARSRCGLTATFGRSEAQRRVLAALDRRLEPWLPERWRYVGVLVARRAA